MVDKSFPGFVSGLKLVHSRVQSSIFLAFPFLLTVLLLRFCENEKLFCVIVWLVLFGLGVFCFFAIDDYCGFVQTSQFPSWIVRTHFGDCRCRRSKGRLKRKTHNTHTAKRNNFLCITMLGVNSRCDSLHNHVNNPIATWVYFHSVSARR